MSALRFLVAPRFGFCYTVGLATVVHAVSQQRWALVAVLVVICGFVHVAEQAVAQKIGASA